jgi:signal transduction histidine kinase
VAQLAEQFSTQSDIHTISARFSTDFPIIRADEKRIQEVFENLLSNALKYSPAGGEVVIGGEAREGEVLLFVRDEGLGIEESEKELIFERFYRVDDQLSRSTQGAGLGLYLVKSIINAHQGRLHLHSAPGRGSVFYFTLPIEPEE